MAVLQKIFVFVALVATFSSTDAGSSESGSGSFEGLSFGQISQALPAILSALKFSPDSTKFFTTIFPHLMNSPRFKRSSGSNSGSGEFDFDFFDTLMQKLMSTYHLSPQSMASFSHIFPQLFHGGLAKRSGGSSGSGSFDMDMDYIKSILENMLSSFGVGRSGIFSFGQFFDGLFQGSYSKRSSGSGDSGGIGGLDFAALKPMLVQMLNSFGVSYANQDMFIKMFFSLLSN